MCFAIFIETKTNRFSAVSVVFYYFFFLIGFRGDDDDIAMTYKCVPTLQLPRRGDGYRECLTLRKLLVTTADSLQFVNNFIA